MIKFSAIHQSNNINEEKIREFQRRLPDLKGGASMYLSAALGSLFMIQTMIKYYLGLLDYNYVIYNAVHGKIIKLKVKKYEECVLCGGDK